MTTTPERNGIFRRLWRSLYTILLGVVFIALTTLILLFPILPTAIYDFSEGDIPPEDIRAPREVTYTSQIETTAARDTALASVTEIYDDADPRIGRQQVRRARQIMDYVQDVRADPFASEQLRISYLREVDSLSDLPSQDLLELLAVTDSQYEQVENEIVNLVEEAMSGTVREGLEGEVADQLELKVSPALSEELIDLTLAAARPMVVPNSFLNEEATQARRDAALAAVPEIRQTFRPNEVVVQGGVPITALDLEALEALGLATDIVTSQDVASAILISLMVTVVMAVHVGNTRPAWAAQRYYSLLVVVLALLFLVSGQIMLGGQDTIAYMFPAAALSMVLAALVGLQFAALGTILIAMLLGYMAGSSLEMAIYFGLSGLLAAGGLRRGLRLNSFFRGGIFVAVTGAAVIMIFRLPSVPASGQLVQLLLMAILNGLLSAGIALVLLYVVGSLTGITTSLQLIDLMRPDHPLQIRLQQEALGTYQHTLSVATLAETAAEAIGANSLLTRVGTLYHDIGKMANPGFFIENRAEIRDDPHAGLSPSASAQMIKSHVTEGVELAKRHRLPPEIITFIPEHHGTMPILFFLSRARDEAKEAGLSLDESLYHYDGPAPQRPETAIVMLADSCESAVRANRPTGREDIENVVNGIIDQRIKFGQMDHSALTMTDLTMIRESFIRTLTGMYHPRIKYPDDKPDEPESDTGVHLHAEAYGDDTNPAQVIVVHAHTDTEPSTSDSEDA